MRTPDDHSRQQLFREVNERIREIHASFGGLPEAYEVFCECGRPWCVERLEVPAVVFEEVRVGELRAIVRPGHERAGREQTVAEETGYRVIALRRPRSPKPRLEPLPRATPA